MFSETIRLPASRITAVGRVSQQVQQDEGDVQADLAATGEAGGRRRRCVPIFCEVQSVLLKNINIDNMCHEGDAEHRSVGGAPGLGCRQEA
jgi:hypothetical protein